MLLTIKNAERMACPHQLLAGTGCHGDQCMAWRWANVTERGFHAAENPTALTEEEAGPRCAPDSWEWCGYDFSEGDAGWREPRREADARRLGFCGLAGTPIDFI